MMGDEVLRAADDPRQIANAKRISLGERSCQGQSSWISQTARPLGRKTECFGPLIRSRPDRLGQGKIEAEQVAAIIDGHENILTDVDTYLGGYMT